MEQGVLLAPIGKRPSASASAELALNLTIVYEDAPTRQWAGEVCARVGRLIGREAVRSSWWKVSELSEPAVLAGAVSTALRADVVIVAIHTAEGLSLPFYYWVDSWLPNRSSRVAALVALVAIPDRPSLALEQAQDYLRKVAREGEMDFLLEERKLPSWPARSPQYYRPQLLLPTAKPSAVRGRSLERASTLWRIAKARFTSPAAA